MERQSSPIDAYEFALLDAAIDPLIFEFSQNYPDYCVSLYSGSAAEQMREFAPYLFEIAAPNEFRERLYKSGWGKSWGVFVKSKSDLSTLKQHFRRCYVATLPTGRKAYFRFFDPRVLNAFFRTADNEQIKAIFGTTVIELAAESKDGTELIRYGLQNGRFTSKNKVIIHYTQGGTAN